MVDFTRLTTKSHYTRPYYCSPTSRLDLPDLLLDFVVKTSLAIRLAIGPTSTTSRPTTRVVVHFNIGLQSDLQTVDGLGLLSFSELETGPKQFLYYYLLLHYYQLPSIFYRFWRPALKPLPLPPNPSLKPPPFLRLEHPCSSLLRGVSLPSLTDPSPASWTRTGKEQLVS